LTCGYISGEAKVSQAHGKKVDCITFGRRGDRDWKCGAEIWL